MFFRDYQVELLVLNLRHEKKASLKKAKEKPVLDIEKSILVYDRVTERMRRNFFEYNPELLSKSLRDVMTELDDKRETPFNTIFSAPSIGQMDPGILASMPIPLDKYYSSRCRDSLRPL